MTLLPPMPSLMRMVGALRRRADRAALYEHVDSALLDVDAFRASDSMGLDGAPSMVFVNAMPPYARSLDRPSTRGGRAPLEHSETTTR